ncbi:MAG: cytochrome c family protein [Hyphomicrobiaceae bacterium]
MISFKLSRPGSSATILAATSVLVLSSMSLAAVAQDAENGESLFRQCRACHKIGPGAASSPVGPQLNGIVGRKAASVSGFNYSTASKQAAAKGLVWTEENLMKYLENPRAFMPGTRMAYAGLRDADQRRDLIAYLKKFK